MSERTPKRLSLTALVGRIYDSMKAALVGTGTKAASFAYEKTPDRFKNASDLQIRIRTGVVYFVVSVVMTMACEVTLAILLSVTAAIAALELCNMLKEDAKLPNTVLCMLGAAAYPASLITFDLAGTAVVTAVLGALLLIWYLSDLQIRYTDVCATMFSAAYTGMTLSCLLTIESTIPGFWGRLVVLGVFVGVWLCDSFAYLVGRKIGKHKMAPRISPKKSWEGFFGGLVGSALIWVVISFVPGVEMSILQAVCFGVICGTAGVLGDLMESRIKRNCGVKDSGTIMPGHGGFLDRTDSMFVASPTALALLVIGGCIHVM